LARARPRTTACAPCTYHHHHQTRHDRRHTLDLPTGHPITQRTYIHCRSLTGTPASAYLYHEVSGLADSTLAPVLRFAVYMLEPQPFVPQARCLSPCSPPLHPRRTQAPSPLPRT
jgi:hypothetical protein